MLLPGVLAVPLLAPALDLLASVQPDLASPTLGTVASAATSVLLLITWVQFPRTGWLAAAGLAALASLALRLAGVELAPLLSLLALVGLGVGGAFAAPSGSAWAEENPVLADDSPQVDAADLVAV